MADVSEATSVSEATLVNPFLKKPINDVKDTLHTVSRNLNTIKTDVVSIKSDLMILKEMLNQMDEKKAVTSSKSEDGWWFS